MSLGLEVAMKLFYNIIIRFQKMQAQALLKQKISDVSTSSAIQKQTKHLSKELIADVWNDFPVWLVDKYEIRPRPDATVAMALAVGCRKLANNNDPNVYVLLSALDETFFVLALDEKKQSMDPREKLLYQEANFMYESICEEMNIVRKAPFIDPPILGHHFSSACTVV